MSNLSKSISMKTILIIITTLFLSVTVSEDIQNMYKILESKKISELITYFDSSIELSILNDDFYGDEESAAAITEFFSEKDIELFEIIHNGGDENESYFIIGKLVVSGKVYRIHLLIERSDEKDRIIEMSIDNE